MADFDDDDLDEFEDLDELEDLDEELDDPDLEEALGEDYEGIDDEELEDYGLEDLELDDEGTEGDTGADDESGEDVAADEGEGEQAPPDEPEEGAVVEPGAGDSTALVEDDDLLDDVEDHPAPLDRELDVDDEVREGEFVCRSCFMAKRESALADEDRMLCRDCV